MSILVERTANVRIKKPRGTNVLMALSLVCIRNKSTLEHMRAHIDDKIITFIEIQKLEVLDKYEIRTGYSANKSTEENGGLFILKYVISVGNIITTVHKSIPTNQFDHVTPSCICSTQLKKLITNKFSTKFLFFCDFLVNSKI
jgi:hypothetical protein